MNTSFITKDQLRKDNITQISKWVVASLLIFTILEAAYYPEGENLYGCLTFIIAWAILYTFVFRVKGSERNKCLLPFLALLALGLSFFWLPLIVTFIEGKPLTFNFENSYQTFTLQLLNLIMLIAAYQLCLRVYHQENFIQQLWAKLGYFTTPSDLQIWVMGLIGLISFILIIMVQGTDDAQPENMGFIGHLLMVTRTFSYFPFLILFKEQYSNDRRRKNYKVPLFIYFCIMILLGITTGKRTTIFGPVVTMVICYLLPAFTQNKRVFSTRNTIIILIGLYLVTGPVADFAAAMALGRDNSMRTSGSQTFANVWRIYNDKELLHTLYQYALTYSDNGGNNDSGWSEYYVDNILLDRFCNIRVCDATIYYANKLGYDNPRMHEYFNNGLLYLLPTPILNILGVHVNKFEGQYTPGDLMSTEGLNLREQYYGYRVAGDVGVGLYLWGYMYYIYAFFIYVALFYFLSTKVHVGYNNSVTLPLPEMCGIYTVFMTFNNSTGIVGVVEKLLRTGWQAIVVYCIIYYFIRILTRPFQGGEVRYDKKYKIK